MSYVVGLHIDCSGCVDIESVEWSNTSNIYNHILTHTTWGSSNTSNSYTSQAIANGDIEDYFCTQIDNTGKTAILIVGFNSTESYSRYYMHMTSKNVGSNYANSSILISFIPDEDANLDLLYAEKETYRDLVK